MRPTLLHSTPVLLATKDSLTPKLSISRNILFMASSML